MIDALLGALGDIPGLAGSIIRVIIVPIAGAADGVIDLLPEPVALGITAPTGWVAGYALIETLAPLNLALGFLLLFGAIDIAGGMFRLGERLYHLIPKPFTGT